MLELFGASQDLTVEDFSEVERISGFKLTQAFKTFYVRNNGGYAINGEFEGDESVFSLNGFNPIKYGRPCVEQLMMRVCEEHGFLQGLVPFAYDDGGNTFMLSLRETDFDVVYLWIHGERRLDSVISSFEGFLKAVEVGCEV